MNNAVHLGELTEQMVLGQYGGESYTSPPDLVARQERLTVTARAALNRELVGIFQKYEQVTAPYIPKDEIVVLGSKKDAGTDPGVAQYASALRRSETFQRNNGATMTSRIDPAIVAARMFDGLDI